MNLTVLGAGSFGTAISHYAAKLGHDVRLWCRDAAQAETINAKRVNPRYLKDLELHELVKADSDFESSVVFADKIILAIPTQSLRSLLERLAKLNLKGKKILSLTKGMETGTGKLPHKIAEEVLPGISYSALSGPCHAEEVVREQPTAVVVASQSHETAMEWQRNLNSPLFRIYTSDDLLGIELGGAVKNVIAIAVGISQSLNLGDNAKAALATRGLAEITRLGAMLGASPLTLAGLAGAGDLMVTCYSNHSRNLRFGLALGRGLSMEDAASEIGQAIEGIRTAQALVSYAREADVELPIVEGVHSILFGGASVNQAFEKLLFRDPKPEQIK